MQRDLEIEAEFGEGSGKTKSDLDKDAISKRLEEIYKRLEFIDADAAEARAASILAVSLFSLSVPFAQYHVTGLLLLLFKMMYFILSSTDTCLK
jgi:hypothetical protein